MTRQSDGRAVDKQPSSSVTSEEPHPFDSAPDSTGSPKRGSSAPPGVSKDTAVTGVDWQAVHDCIGDAPDFTGVVTVRDGGGAQLTSGPPTHQGSRPSHRQAPVTSTPAGRPVG